MSDTKLVQIVIPVYNEGAVLEQALLFLGAALDHISNVRIEILLVDDGSTDNTWDVIQVHLSRVQGLRAIRFSRNFGKEAAIAAGLDHAKGDAVIVMDADLQHPPDLIPEMLRLWVEEKYDVVDATKESRGREAFWYALSVRLFTSALCSLSGFDMHGASDFKLLDRRVINAWQSMHENVIFYRAMTEWVGFRHARLPMNVAARAGGQSNWNFVRLLRLATTAMTSFSTSALHFATVAGFLSVLAAVVLGIYTIIYWFGGETLEGFSTVIILQLVIGGIIMIMLGIIGEYLSTVFREVKKRPRYIVREEIGP